MMLPPALNIPKWYVRSHATCPSVNHRGVDRPRIDQELTHACLSRLEANSHLLQPPVNNYCVYHPSSPATAGYTVMIVGGPNARTDYHINTTPEFFYQYQGSMLLKTVDTSTTPPTFQDIPIHEGSIFLLPANTPHCPVRFKDTVGVVMEQPRAQGGGRCYEMVKAVVEEFGADEEKRRCKACGEIAATRYAEGELVQPPSCPE
ncbi:3-hydroxyanthranilate 3-4-dioxygenase 1 [Penicillium maclennaniae]|uniref:3-hydroxyanthranilate 3-4-dioxygenase 1 n=1 Tax=Penicillium maclennaniae TaxID=1343394 RepID=UPI0025426586|nr:3-hydroxyanthranilate 3-4-dioxygenase 1 [Penicillium maclennaniae]KAJ5677495.1 3-hydroxyanthranilate 3-4-dioxygenase 1 [Penicillium maclennaniae]